MYNNPEGWKDYDPKQVMSFIYWTKQQLPPAEGTPEWEANWEKAQSFLNSKFPVKENFSRALQVTTENGVVAIIEDPTDIEAYDRGNTVIGVTADGKKIELNIDWS